MESSTVSPTSSSDSGPSSSSSSGLAAVDSSESELEDFQEPGQEVLSAVKAGSTFFFLVQKVCMCGVLKLF